MKRLKHLLTILALSSAILPSGAVTVKEMDQARAIAAKAYLRYANDGSGYLDDVKAGSMAELEKHLKPKEKENLKAFKAIAVPADHAKWDKEKLVEYWSTTAFASKGLLDKGRIGKSRARKGLMAMTIAKPAAEPKPATEPKQAQPAKAVEEPAKVSEPKNAEPALQPVAAVQDSLPAEVAAAAETVAAAPVDEFDEPIEKANSHTWIYVVVLCILVGVVVALVVFASNIMKKGEANGKSETPKADIPAEEAHSAAREEFAAKLAAKNAEIKQLNRKLESLNNENSMLRGKLEALTAEVTTLRRRPVQQNPNGEAVKEEVKTEVAVAEAPMPPAPKTRTYYVGRANQRGFFECADRVVKIGSSVFRLDSADGYVGTFRVINEQGVWINALKTPAESLGGACQNVEPSEAVGKMKIVTDAAGTAVNEGGYWRVIRKAKIHFE